MKRIFGIVLLLTVFLTTGSVDAATYYSWRYRNSSDCTALTNGKNQDLCKQDDGKLYKCVPDGDDVCDTPAEWKIPEELVEDTSPQLGGDLDGNHHSISDVKSITVTPTDASDSVFRTSSLQSSAPLGSDLVTNGDFNSDLSDWTAGTGWSWNNGTALHASGNTDPITQSITVTDGAVYQVEYTISNSNSGSITIDIGGVYIYYDGDNKELPGNESRKRTLVASGSGAQLLTITPSSDFDGAVDNIAVKQITGTSQPFLTALDDSNDVALEMRGDAALTSIFMGQDAGKNNTAGYDNTFLGHQAGMSNTTGASNIFIGARAGQVNTTGFENVFIGRDAGKSNTRGISNIFIGPWSGQLNTTGEDNIFIGSMSGYFNTTGHDNIFLGLSSGVYNTTGYYNAFIGRGAGYSNTTGNSNSGVGVGTLVYNTTGSNNTANGVASLKYNTTGTSNTATGNEAGSYIADGSTANRTGNNNVFVGAETKALADGDTNEIVIGYDAVGAGSNSVVIGNDDITKTVLKGNVFVRAVRLNTDDTKPACDSDHRGTMWFTKGDTGVKDTLEVCAKDASDAYAWRTLY